MIDWCSEETAILINPRLPAEEAKEMRELLSQVALKGHLWLATSGTKELKWVALSKEAILTSAEAVNRALGSDKNDIWLNPLPSFHVGGLGITARAYLSHATVITELGKWDPLGFYQKLPSATLTSLVPAQLYDLIHLKLPAPPLLRAVIVGEELCQSPSIARPSL